MTSCTSMEAPAMLHGTFTFLLSSGDLVLRDIPAYSQSHASIRLTCLQSKCLTLKSCGAFQGTNTATDTSDC